MKLREIAELVNGTLAGDGEAEVFSVASPENAGPFDLVFIANASSLDLAKTTNAGCLIKPPDLDLAFDGATITVSNPKSAFASAGAMLYPRKTRPAGIHPSAVISENASIGENVFIDAFCCVGDGSVIGSGSHLCAGSKVGDKVMVGEDCTFHPNAYVDDGCIIGDRVVLKAGAVIGAGGFGFVRDGGKLTRFPQIGTVVIEDDVEIGANTCVDRGALGETRIGEGTKIDNLVQVAHNVSIGKRVVIASQTGISGSVSIGDDCVIGGQVGFADHTEIADGTIIGAKSAVFPGKKLRGGAWGGIPVRPLDEYKRLQAHIRSLPRLKEDVDGLKEMAKRLGVLVRRNPDEEGQD
jgi:UDP-3-O-[3-hydroxymyristoyl] glucosamine N-acyltransferase